ncbi:hypothetical protein AFK24_09300 [Pseudomonas syringae]|uniref:Uncharacterized protein n=1 Tax=Pseudomonas syringae TaxID=317 RepID=A0A1C7Z878_PSESX|nr:alpha/beta hydrolase [Pseudomonas syringae]OCR25256.1 hypothetical protein AFK24_09300 [Pseudomonas syringae]
MANPQHLENFLKSVDLSKFQMGDFTANLPDIKTPTLITWGRDDRFVPIDWSLKLLNGFTCAPYSPICHKTRSTQSTRASE